MASLLVMQMSHILCFSTNNNSMIQIIKQRQNTINYTQLHSIFNDRGESNTNAVISENNNNQKEDSSTLLRKTILGLTFPLFVAISANAPFLYVILNPPTPEEREVMLMDFCKGDTCTLLGGGSGYTGGGEIDYATTDVISSDALQAIPTVEEFEAMARLAAEIADGIH